MTRMWAKSLTVAVSNVLSVHLTLLPTFSFVTRTLVLVGTNADRSRELKRCDFDGDVRLWEESAASRVQVGQ